MRAITSCSNDRELRVAVYQVHLTNLVMLILFVQLVDAVPVNPQILKTKFQSHFDAIIYDFWGIMECWLTAVTLDAF